MTKEQILQQADAVANKIAEIEKEKAEFIKEQDHKIEALVDKEQMLRKQAEQVSDPEKLFLEIIDGMAYRAAYGKFYDKNGEWLFEIEKQNVWCSYFRVWSRISDATSGDYKATQAFIKSQMEKHLTMKDVTPQINKHFS